MKSRAAGPQPPPSPAPPPQNLSPLQLTGLTSLWDRFPSILPFTSEHGQQATVLSGPSSSPAHALLHAPPRGPRACGSVLGCTSWVHVLGCTSWGACPGVHVLGTPLGESRVKTGSSPCFGESFLGELAGPQCEAQAALSPGAQKLPEGGGSPGPAAVDRARLGPVGRWNCWAG